MFVGHLGTAFVAKRISPPTSLVWFVLAANLVDLLWPFALLAGIESVRIAPGFMPFTPVEFTHYPWTHSLVMGIVLGAVLGHLAYKSGVPRSHAAIVALLVPSHWVLDFVTHAPDLPVWPGGPKVGLGLWNSIPATFAVEGLLWVAGIALFLVARRPRGVQGHVAFWSFVIVSTLMWASGPWSSPPPDERSLALFALMGWIIIPWSWWIERTSMSPSEVGRAERALS
jgi:membrane-bound metal-dependent hydrolase YbcI (DUF457 family)